MGTVAQYSQIATLLVLLNLASPALLEPLFAEEMTKVSDSELTEESSTLVSIVMPGDLVDQHGEPQFFGQAAIEDLLAQEYKSLGTEPGVTTDAQMAFKRVSSLIRRSANQNSVDEEGCSRPFSYRHREEAYQLAPDDFEDPAQGFLQTPLDLARKAPEIVVVEAVGAEPGVLDGELGTLVRFSVVEWLQQDPELVEIGDPDFFLQSDVWMTIDGRPYCQRRRDVQEPVAGDRFVLFGLRAETIAGHFWTGNIFPLDGDLVLPQPYPLMWEGLPISLEALKEVAR
ncbi:MAG: hypothetical protein AAGD01_14645 [Acidobacteriota bacterium]